MSRRMIITVPDDVADKLAHLAEFHRLAVSAYVTMTTVEKHRSMEAELAKHKRVVSPPRRGAPAKDKGRSCGMQYCGGDGIVPMWALMPSGEIIEQDWDHIGNALKMWRGRWDEIVDNQMHKCFTLTREEVRAKSIEVAERWNARCADRGEFDEMVEVPEPLAAKEPAQ